MEISTFLLEELFKKFLKEHNIPFIQIFDKDFLYSTSLQSEESFKYLPQCAEWEKLIHEQKTLLDKRKKDHVAFSYKQDFHYFLKEMKAQEKTCGFAIIGGFTYPKNDFGIQETIYDLHTKLKNFLSCIHPSVCNAFLLVSEDLSKQYTIKQIATENFMSPSKFQATFKECLGISFGEFVISLKMRHAYALLEKTHSINDVATQLGYANSSSFRRAFAKYEKERKSN